MKEGTPCATVGRSLIEQLGLEKMGTRRIRIATGSGEAAIYSAVRHTIQGRDCTTGVMELPDNIPVLIGQLPLENHDFVVDMRNHALIGNPAHDGEHIVEMY